MTWTPFTNWRAGNHELHEHDQPYEKTVITLQFARGHLSAAEHKHWPFKHQKWFTKLFILRPRASQLKHTYVLSDNMIKQCISSAQIYFPENINPFLQIRYAKQIFPCIWQRYSKYAIMHVSPCLYSCHSTHASGSNELHQYSWYDYTGAFPPGSFWIGLHHRA